MEVTIAEHQIRLQSAIGEIFRRFHEGALTPDDFVDASSVDATIDVAGVDGWINGKIIAEPDIQPFRRLNDPNTVILDVGAHLGYTAASIRNLPTSNFIHSFEPMSLYNPMLSRLGEIDAKYSYSNIAAIIPLNGMHSPWLLMVC